MTTTLRVDRSSRPSQRPRSLVKTVAKETGYSPATMSQLIYGKGSIHHRMIDLLDRLKRHGAHGLAAKLLADVTAAHADMESPRLTSDTFMSAAEAEARMMVAEEAYQLRRGDVERDTLLRALDADILKLITLRDALKGVQEGCR